MGIAASVLGRTYLEVLLNGTGVGFTSIPLGGVLDEEVQIATASLDQPVVVDVSTLVAMTFLPDLWPTVLAALSSVSIATTSVAEVNDSTLAKAPAFTVNWDHQRDALVITPASDEQLQAIAAQREQVREWTAELQIVPAGERSNLPGGEALQDLNDSGTWDASLTAAHAKNDRLLSDDVALAALARSVGVPAFGSFALLMALAAAGRITTDQVDGFVTKLYAAQADDMPLSPVRLAAIAISRDWPLNTAIHPMTRPAYWREPEIAFSAFAATIDGFRDTPNSAGRTLYAATVGVIRAVVAGSPLPIIGQLFAQAMLALEAEPEAVAELVAAMRAACDGRDLPDPLPAAVRSLLDLTSSALEPGELGVFVTTAFSLLEQEDRITAASIFLD
ncbi:hypothetical protein BH18ACT2_BH18ACT2_08880 [soil metagenome]